MDINKFDTLLDTVKDYLSQFRQQFDLVTKHLKTAPDGKIKIVKKGHRTELYHRTSKADKEGTYLNKVHLTLTKNLAQKDYDLRAAKILSKKIKLLALWKSFTPRMNWNSYTSVTLKKCSNL